MADKADEKKDEGTGTDPEKKTETPASDQGDFNTANLSDTDFDKVFEDQRLFRHPRFKSLNEKAKRAEELENEKDEAEKKKLEEDKKFQELSEKLKGEKEALESKLAEQAIDNRIIGEASKLGIKDTEAALKLIDRAGITNSKDGNVEGVTEAVKALTENRPYLVTGEQQTPIGSGTNPANAEEGGVKKFKLSDITNPDFYKEHSVEIDKAMTIPGGITDDVSV